MVSRLLVEFCAGESGIGHVVSHALCGHEHFIGRAGSVFEAIPFALLERHDCGVEGSQDFLVCLFSRVCLIRRYHVVDSGLLGQVGAAYIAVAVFKELIYLLAHAGAYIVRISHGGVVGVSVVGDVVERVILINECVVGAEGRLFIEEAYRVVVLQNHRGVSRPHLAGLVTAVPVSCESGGRSEVGGRGEFLVVDAHVGAARAIGNRLQGNVEFLVVAVAAGWENEDFAVGGVALRHGATVAAAREGYRAPRTGGSGLICIGKDIEIASAIGAAAEHYGTVGQFFALRLVAGGSRRDVDAAERVPRLAEVVGINHTVAVGACAKGGVDAIVRTNLNLTALADAARTEEEALHCAERAGIEKGIDVFGDFLISGPRCAVVFAVEACHAVGVAARCGGSAVNGVAANADKHHLAGLGVGHGGCIAEAAVYRAACARALCNLKLCAPRLSVVLRDAAVNVYAAVADVGTAIAIVAHSKDVAVLSRRDGGNAVRVLTRLRDEDVCLLLYGCGALLNGDDEVGGIDKLLFA